MPAVALGELVDPERRRHAEVHRLAGLFCERVEMLVREIDQRDVGLGPLCEAEEDRPGPHRPAVAVALEEALSFERGEEPGRRALRQLGGLGELADSERPRALHHAHEQLRRPVDRLSTGHNHIMEPAFHKRKSLQIRYLCRTVPIGYLVGVAFVAWCTLFALAAPRPRRSSPRNLSYWFAYLLNELPFVAFYWLLASTLLAVGQGDVDTPGGWAVFGLAVLTTVGLAVVAWRGLRARAAVDQALSEGLGAGWRSAIDAGLAARLRGRPPLVRILFGPFFVRRRDVERIANLSYGDAGSSNLLDVYRHRSRPSGGPVLIHLHGGAFRSGRKNREARPLLYRLASQGWVCISANYRLSPAGDVS